VTRLWRQLRSSARAAYHRQTQLRCIDREVVLEGNLSVIALQIDYALSNVKAFEAEELTI
jgi:hypothetical protein